MWIRWIRIRIRNPGFPGVVDPGEFYFFLRNLIRSRYVFLVIPNSTHRVRKLERKLELVQHAAE
jgi:hypothetical protein